MSRRAWIGAGGIVALAAIAGVGGATLQTGRDDRAGSPRTLARPLPAAGHQRQIRLVAADPGPLRRPAVRASSRSTPAAAATPVGPVAPAVSPVPAPPAAPPPAATVPFDSSR